MRASWSRWLNRWKTLLANPRPRRRPVARLSGHWFGRLEDRLAPATFGGGVRVAAFDVNGDGVADLIAGAGPGGGPHVKVYSGKTGTLLQSFMAFDPAFTGGVSVAAGDVGGKGVADIVVGAGAGGGPQVNVYNGKTGALVRSFMAFDPAFTGGVSVAVADVNGDGFADIVVGAGPGGGPQVKVFSGKDGALLKTFMAYAPDFSGGVNVAAGDFTGDGHADIVTGAGAGGGPHVKVFDGVTGAVLDSFLAYAPDFSGGVNVAVGDVTGDGKPDIITGAGAGGGPHVKVFKGDPVQFASFFAYSAAFNGGASVAVADFTGDGKADIITGAGPGGGPAVGMFNGATDAVFHGFFAFDGPVPTPVGPLGATEGTTPPPPNNDKTPPTLTLTSPTNFGTKSTNVIVTGSAVDEAGGSGVAAVRVSVDGQAAGDANLTRSGAGESFSFTTALPLDGSADGAHTLSIVAADKAGNASAAQTATFTLRTKALTPTFDLDDASDTGVKGNQRTELATVTLVGTTDPNSTATLKMGTGTSATTVATVTADAAGMFTFTAVALTSGANDFSVDVTNPARQTNTFARTIFLNNPPMAVGTLANVNTFGGAADTTVDLAGAFSDPDTASAGDVLTFTAVSSNTAVATVSVGTGSAASMLSVHPLAGSGTTQVTVTATDKNGLTATQTFTVNTTSDTTAPTLTLTSPADRGTTNKNVTVTGTAADTGGSGLAAVEGSVDGGAFVAGTVDASGNFSFTTALLLDGTADKAHTIVLRARDGAGNLSPTKTVTFTLKTQVQAPAFDLADASDTGVKGNQRTELSSVTLTGTTAANAAVTLTKGGTTVATGTADASGNFSFTTVGLVAGANAFTAQAKDAAGNTTMFNRTIYLNSAPTADTTIADKTVAHGAADVKLDLADFFSDANANSKVRFATSEGNVDVMLYDQQTPLTAANFLTYVNSGAYNNTIIHRSIPGFVVQGGGFALPIASATAPTHIPQNAAVQNEPGISNLTGTVALAKTNAGPSTGTSEFFFNLGDNSANLDAQNGGFTAFGRVTPAGQTTVTAIAAIPTKTEPTGGDPNSVLFGNLPLKNYTGTNFPTDTTPANFVVINGVTVTNSSDGNDALTYTVSSSNPTLVTASIGTADARAQQKLALHFGGGTATGTARITVTATDKNGLQASQTFTVTVT